MHRSRNLPPFHNVWCTASDVDGSRHPVVERAVAEWGHALDGVADEAGYSTPLEWLSPSADAGQSGAFSWRAATGTAVRSVPRQQPQAWLDKFRWEASELLDHNDGCHGFDVSSCE